MKPYLRKRARNQRRSTVTGILATVGIHAVAGIVLVSSGLSYLDPPPPEQTFLIDFEPVPMEEVPVENKSGEEPQAEEAVNPEEPVELVQQAESPNPVTTPNTTPATPPDPHGDVETPDPQVEEPVLDPRASFPGISRNPSESTTPHEAVDTSRTFKEGQGDGNTREGKTEGKANAHLEGRNVVGTIPSPVYNVQAEGTVVVSIKVDQYGTVTEAVPGAEGTTITDKTLWNAARQSALKSHFNQKADAPVLQSGTITYKFKLQ